MCITSINNELPVFGKFSMVSVLVKFGLLKEIKRDPFMHVCELG